MSMLILYGFSILVGFTTRSLEECPVDFASPVTRPSWVHPELDGRPRHRLVHRFVAGTARQYCCVMKTVHRAPEEAESVERENTGPSKAAIVSDQRLVLKEQETCFAELQDGVADVAYQGLSVGIETLRGGQVVYRFSEEGRTEELRRHGIDPATLGIGGAFDPIRYRIDRTMRVRDVTLPASVLESFGKTDARESYRKALEARYRSFFPDGEVGPGDEWNGRIPFQEGFWQTAASSSVDYRVRMQHAGYLRHRGFDCALVHLDMEFASPPGTALRKEAFGDLLCDGFVARSWVVFAVREGFPLLERSRLELRLRRTHKVQGKVVAVLPTHAVQYITTSWIRTLNLGK